MQRLVGSPSAQDLTELAREIVKIACDGDRALVTGAQGTGKFALLREVQAELTRLGVGFVVSPGTEGETDPDSVLLIDDLTAVPDEEMAALSAHPGSVVAMLESGRHQRAYSTAVLNVAYGSHPLGLEPQDVRRFHLDPLPAEEMARFLHRHSPDPLDSAAVDAITSLAMGRRSWALDLVQLFAQHQIQTDPYPMISAHLAPGEFPLPALQRVRRAIGDIPDECAAAAIALSEIEPLDEMGVGALIDAGVAEVLLSSGVLVPLEQTQRLTVPGFVAAALRQQSPLDLVERWRQRVASGLLAQARMGLPLSERETLFCVRAWSAAGQIPAELADTHRDLVLRTVSKLTAFGDPTQIRTAALTFAAHQLQLPPLPRARAMAALGNAREAIDLVDTIRHDDPRALVSTRLVRHILVAETGHDPAHQDADALDDTGEEVLRLWNRIEPLGDDGLRMRQAAERHPDPLIRTLAALLVDLDAVRDGRVPPYSSSLQAPRALPALGIPATGEVSDAASTVLVAQGLILLLAGESAARSQRLMEAAARLADADYHAPWLRHMIAAGTAATFGEMTRALSEWERFAERVPHLVPLRLRHHIDRVGKALAAAADPDDTPDDLGVLSTELPYRICLYFAGLHGPLQRFRGSFDSSPGTLALVRLARAHLDAASDRNPARLVRIAEHFETYEMWLPSAYALSDARRIYLGRRAVAKVRECDEALTRVRGEILRHAPWREPGVTELAVSLTPRELDAARLAATGLRNREIAEQLECGVRTVESHIAQARAKLGAATREDLARLLPRVDPL